MTTTYSVGTVTVANGGTSVTGVGTSWVGKIFEGDLFTDPAQGLFARVTADATSNTSLSINPWPGVGMTADPYEVLLQADSIRASERTRQLLEQMSVVQANGRGLFYRFSDSVTDADPGSGYLRLNNAAASSATAAYLDNLDADGATVSALLDSWDDSTSTTRGQLWLRSIAEPSSFRAYSVTGSVVDGTGYRKLTLTHIGGSGSFAADDELMVFFVAKGDKGADGAAGATLLDTSAAATLANARNLVVKYVTAATVDIDADRLVLFDSSGNGLVVNAVNLTADISTSGANGRGTGISETGNLWYYMFVGDGGGTPYCWLDTSATGANDPGGSTYKGRVGAVRNDGSSDFVEFLQRGREVTTGTNFTVGKVVTNGAATTYTTVSLAAAVPPTAVSVDFEAEISTTSGTAPVSMLVAPAGSGTTAVYGVTRLINPSQGTAALTAPAGKVALAVAQQVVYRVSGTNAQGSLRVSGYSL
jgi:hypothetical protein